MGGHRVAAALIAAGIVAQMLYPALDGDPLVVATVAAVVLLGAGALAHAWAVLGRAAAGRLLLIGPGIGLSAEVLGVHTGVPFGSYHYTQSLGPALFGVPVVVPLAWLMLGYPCLLLGRRVGRWLGCRLAERAERRATGPVAEGPTTRRPATQELVTRGLVAVVGGWTLAAWDLYLDPQMVAAGHWVWHHPEPALPGVPGIPLTNYLGWIVVSVVMIAALDRLLPDVAPTAHTPWAMLAPTAVLVWTWLGSALGNLVLFDRPAVAGWGLVGMGLGVLPFLLLGRSAAASGRMPSGGDAVDLRVGAG